MDRATQNRILDAAAYACAALFFLVGMAALAASAPRLAASSLGGLGFLAAFQTYACSRQRVVIEEWRLTCESWQKLSEAKQAALDMLKRREQP